MRSPAFPGSDSSSAPPRTGMRRRWLLQAGSLSLLGSFGISGCGAIPPPNLKAPILSFRDLQVRDVNLDRVNFDLIVEAQNPNDVDIPISGLTYTLDVIGRELARGSATEASIVLPKAASRTVPLAFTARTADLLDALRRMPGGLRDGIDYRLKGRASWGNSGIQLPFERKGSIDPLASLRRLIPLIRPEGSAPARPGTPPPGETRT